MNTTSPLYRLALRAAVPLVPLVLRAAPQRAAHRGRLESTAALAEWGRHRDRSRPVAWFHASSVGEGLQAEAVLRVFRRRHPGALVVYTHFSPSAAMLAARIGADWSGYLPYDRRADIDRVLEAVDPSLLVFGKVDLWPELAVRAANRGTRVALIAGTVETGSSRLRWPARALARAGYAALHRIGAIDALSAERLVTLGARPDAVTVTGDPRIDSALARAALPAPALWTDDDGPLPLIAGSTWEADERLLLAALFHLIRDVRRPDARLVLVPHEPTPAHLERIDRMAEQLHVAPAVRLSAHPAEAPLPRLLVVDSVGGLAGMYRRGGFAYVGGGFGHRGIHSVLEPAAAGRAVVIGPNDRGSRDAFLLRMAGALHAVKPHQTAAILPGRIGRLMGRGGNDEAMALELSWHWQQWLDAPAEMLSAGASGLAVLEMERGASERSADLLDTLWIRG